MAPPRQSFTRHTALAAVCVGLVAILGAVVAAATSVSATTDRVGAFTYSLTGTANAHREVEKMQVASRGQEVKDMNEIVLRRALATEQLRLALPDLLHRRDPNPEAPRLAADIKRLDEAIAANLGSAPSGALTVAIAAVEIDLKRIFDVEESRVFALNARVVRAKTKSEHLLMVLAGMISVAGVVLLMTVRRSARNNLRQKAEELAAALAALEVVQAERGELLDETVRAGERERTRLAAELHDGPIQALSALCFRLDRVDKKLRRGEAEAAAPLVESVRGELGDEVDELRRLMSELRPPALDEGGLAGATRDYAAAFAQQSGVDCLTRITIANGTLTAEREVVIYRLVQEALTNIRRHSAASRVSLSLTSASEGVELLVIDDGVGFDMAEMAGYVRTSHYGLAGMRERVEAGGGVFSVTSAPGTGVRLRAWLPATNALVGPSGEAQSAA
jgi:signal transduction histidine kinase